MKILYAVSLFSGLTQCIEKGVWEPTGAPTIYKIIEALDRMDDEVVFAFCCKQPLHRIGIGRVQRIYLSGLQSPVWVLPDLPFALLRRSSLGRLMRDIVHACFLLKLHRHHHFDLCYFNNGNLLIAAVFARLRIARVVLRVMGAYPVMKRIVRRARTLGERIERMAYRSPFSHVICSQDGSGGEWFMENILRPEIPRTMMLNGVDRGDADAAMSRSGKEGREFDPDKPVVLFVGKMEPAKGCEEFADAVMGLLSHRQDFYAVMIGGGPSLASIRERVDDAGLGGHIKLIPRVAHSEMGGWYAMSDIYVSLNKLGNLSNANLEAMKHGVCMILLKSDGENHIDEATDLFLPEDTVYRIGRTGMVENLKGALMELLDRPESRRVMANRVSGLAERLIPSWHERIERELRLLEGIAGER